jgi:nitroimidazol reductase NimA-like FMN-containing flavoprotein (pyridoxamine 5'-phosphate oxidase superfamily)
VDAILDEAFVCHLGFCSGGEPVVIPTAYARIGDAIYAHGAPANYALRRAVEGGSVCVTVTLIDGLVLARSAFHHSINYRSVVIFGVAHEVEDLDEKRRALMAFVDHVVPGRSTDTRPPSDSELRATRVVKVEIVEASAKVRDGGPKDDPEDCALTGIWAGELPLQVVPGAPVPDDAAPVTAPVPSYVVSYQRPGPAAARDS